MKIYTVVKTYIDYMYPESSYVNICNSYKDLESAEKAVESEVEKYIPEDEFEDEETRKEYIRIHFRSEDCWIEEDSEEYVEINIVENELLD